MLRFTWLILGLVSLQTVAEEAAVLQCAAVKDSTERLECYDRVAGEALAGKVVPEEVAEAQAVAPDTPGSESVIPEKKRWFNRNTEAADDAPEQVTSVISEVATRATGHHVIKLENGQLWMEDEPGKRRINSDDAVSITKRRFRHTMKLKSSGFIIAVHRID